MSFDAKPGDILVYNREDGTPRYCVFVRKELSTFYTSRVTYKYWGYYADSVEAAKAASRNHGDVGFKFWREGDDANNPRPLGKRPPYTGKRMGVTKFWEAHK